MTAKVVTSAGLNEFIESGKTENMKAVIKEAEAKEAPKEEAKQEPKVEAKEEPKEVPVEADGDLMPEETLEQAKAKIAKKHRELKAEKALRQRIQEERDENERLAESQYNQRRLVESERDKLAREVEELKIRAQPVQVTEIKPPDKSDPKYLNDKGEFQWDKFTDAQAEYRVEQFKAQQREQQQATERAALEARVKERLDVTKAKYPDFEEAVQARDEKDIPPYVMQFLMESEQVGELTYYFAKNREELTKILKLSPIMALARLGKVEARFESKEESPKAEAKVETKVEPRIERTSTAPPPITPISTAGAGTVQLDPSKMDFRQLRAYEREKNKRKG
jgi:hypothetical protein